jgi:hypothetical protein
MWGVDQYRAVCAALDAEGLDAGTGYPPMHRYELFQPLRCGCLCPRTERFDLHRWNCLSPPTRTAGSGLAGRGSFPEPAWKGVDQAVVAIRKVTGCDALAEAARNRMKG